MLSGSLASSLQGEPRATHDIDIVVAIKEALVENLYQAFPPPDYYLDKQSIKSAIENLSMFNLLEVNSGDKVDFWILTKDLFDQSRFSRRYYEDIMGERIAVSAPEDTILMKLKWAKLSGGSEKQYIDVLRVYEMQFDRLDLTYINSWAKRLDVERLWQKLQREAEIV